MSDVTLEVVTPDPVEIDVSGIGPRGPVGAVGAQGPQGIQGIQGAVGPQGPTQGVPVFTQAEEPAGAGPYLWYKTDGAGTILDIYTNGVV